MHPSTDRRSPLRRSSVVRVLCIVGGTVSLILAILGIFLPGLPVTPLALLAAWLYARGSERLHRKLLNSKLLGPRIRRYHEQKGVTKKGKVGIILFMSAMVLVSAFLIVDKPALRITILSLGLIGGLVVWFWVPTAQEPQASNHSDTPSAR